MSFVPDKILDSFDKLTVEMLKENGIRALILDIDNTLVPYEVALPPLPVLNWLEALADAGIKVAFVTNNHKKRLARFNEPLGLPAYASSFKPLAKNIKAAMRVLGAAADSTAIMGDQIYTDVWAGKRAGIRTYLVPPIKDKRDPITRLKRLLERPVLRSYYEKHKEEATK